MTPSVKYAIVALLHDVGAPGMWEHDVHRALASRYESGSLHSVREDLVSLSTVGWTVLVDERAHGDALLRRYALAEHIRSFVEYQLDLPALRAWLERTGGGSVYPAAVRAGASA